MNKKIFSIIFFLLLCIISQGQRVNFGLSIEGGMGKTSEKMVYLEPVSSPILKLGVISSFTIINNVLSIESGLSFYTQKNKLISNRSVIETKCNQISQFGVSIYAPIDDNGLVIPLLLIGEFNKWKLGIGASYQYSFLKGEKIYKQQFVGDYLDVQLRTHTFSYVNNQSLLMKGVVGYKLGERMECRINVGLGLNKMLYCNYVAVINNEPIKEENMSSKMNQYTLQFIYRPKLLARTAGEKEKRTNFLKELYQ